MSSRISIFDEHIDPLELKDSHQLNSHLIESLNSSIESMIKEKKESILPAKKSDIFKKCIHFRINFCSGTQHFVE